MALCLVCPDCVRRKFRYLQMFNGLGPRMRLSGPQRRTLDFEEVVFWAMKHLRKDDRIVWFLGIVQRAAMVGLRRSGRNLQPKILRKIDRKLKDFGEARILDDFQSDFAARWPHYQDLVDVYNLTLMKKYSFHHEIDGRLVPKPASLVLSDHEKMEERLEELAGGERYCTAGEPFLEFSDGWTWFLIKEGASYEEARAMRHCGNGAGKDGDLMISLREPVCKGDVVFWKPHLTFILNDGTLGEMKGYANSKPDKRYHPYVEWLLRKPEVREVRGGGYLPENNFSFADMDITRQTRLLQAKPDLEVDPFGDNGDVLYADESRRWIHVSGPKYAPIIENCGDSFSNWIAFQTPVHAPGKTVWVSHAWCGASKGTLGALALGREDVADIMLPTTAALLSHPELEKFSPWQDPLSPYSNWGKVIEPSGILRLMEDKPAFFRFSPLKDVWKFAGLSDGYVSVLNDRFKLGFRRVEEGVEIRRFPSLLDFAGETGSGRFIRVLGQTDPGELGCPHGVCPFEVPWIKLYSYVTSSSEKTFSLVLNEEGAEIFFEIMNFSGLTDYRGFVHEIGYRFGLRKLAAA